MRTAVTAAAVLVCSARFGRTPGTFASSSAPGGTLARSSSTAFGGKLLFEDDQLEPPQSQRVYLLRRAAALSPAARAVRVQFAGFRGED